MKAILVSIITVIIVLGTVSVVSSCGSSSGGTGTLTITGKLK